MTKLLICILSVWMAVVNASGISYTHHHPSLIRAATPALIVSPYHHAKAHFVQSIPSQLLTARIKQYHHPRVALAALHGQRQSSYRRLRTAITPHFPSAYHGFIQQSPNFLPSTYSATAAATSAAILPATFYASNFYHHNPSLSYSYPNLYHSHLEYPSELHDHHHHQGPHQDLDAVVVDEYSLNPYHNNNNVATPINPYCYR